MEKTLQEYYETKNAIKDLTTYLDKLKPQVMKILAENNGKVDTDLANFTVGTFTTYLYSNRVTELENQLGALKKDEVLSGIATVKSESYSPVMRAKRGGEK